MVSTSTRHPFHPQWATHKIAYRLELVHIEALLQAGQAVDLDSDRQEPDISGRNPRRFRESPRGMSRQDVSSVIERLWITRVACLHQLFQWFLVKG